MVSDDVDLGYAGELGMGVGGNSTPKKGNAQVLMSSITIRELPNSVGADLSFTKCIRILGMPIPDFCAQPYVQNREIAHFPHQTRLIVDITPYRQSVS